MEHIILIISGTAAVCAALFFLIALSPAVAKRLIAGAGIIAVVCGFLFYGYCFAVIHENPMLAVIQTCYAVFLQFLGEGPYEILSESAPMQQTAAQIILNILCFLGVFTTAGAAISAIGGNFLRRLRLRLQWNRDIAILRPLTPQTLEFARDLMAKKNTFVIFVDDSPDATCVEAAQESGCLIRLDEDALSGNVQFLNSTQLFNRIPGIRGRRKIALYALSADNFANRQYACNLVNALQLKCIDSSRTSLTIFANENEITNTISSTDGKFTYGSILCVSPELLAARLLMRNAPTWEAISFDENGCAAEDFQALVVGSGKVGQAVIKQLVMNGQFAGSHFALTVFDPNFRSITGQLCCESRQIFENYDIQVESFDARSGQMYEFLQGAMDKLKYIVVCTGNDHTNLEVARQLAHYMSSHNCALPIHICSRRGLQRITSTSVQRWNIQACQVLCSDDMDRLAMQINHSYCYNDKTPQENWETCDYFSRMSCRASADFAPAFLRMVGLPANTIPEGTWYTEAQMENLAITEHLRWNAFHFCMGFRAMTEEEHTARCETYKAEKKKDPKTRYRITKDLAARTHACLISWDALDALTEKENAVFRDSVAPGEKPKTVNYKEEDRKNVRGLPALMKAAKQ